MKVAQKFERLKARQANTYSKPAIETLEKGVKHVKIQQ